MLKTYNYEGETRVSKVQNLVPKLPISNSKNANIESTFTILGPNIETFGTLFGILETLVLAHLRRGLHRN